MSIIILLSISAVSAADNETDNALGATDQQILSANPPGTFTDLQQEIEGNITAGNPIMELTRDYLYGGSDTLKEIVINNKITINGNNHTIDANHNHGIFTVNDTARGVVLNNITFKNANATHWDLYRAVNVEGADCVINNSYFYGNTMSSSVDNSQGGAIYWAGENGVVINSVFENNRVEITGDDNKNRGGAIFWAGNNGNITNCTFRNNYARTSGAISWGLVIKENDVIDYTKSIMPINGTISECTFEDNKVWYHGAALTSSCENLSIIESNFTDNLGSFSAVIFEEPAKNSNISHCIFKDNTAIPQDGFNQGNYLGSAALEIITFNVTVDYTDFINNHAIEKQESGTDFASYAGAVKVNGHDCINVIFDHCNFNNNSADDFGAVEFQGDYGIMRYCNFYNNSAIAGQYGHFGGQAGALKWDGHYGKILNCNFTNNTAEDEGGAIYWEGNECNITNNCNFTNNFAKSYGGAISSYSENGIISNHCIFFNNTAEDDGGAICWDAVNGIIADYCIFTNNTSTQYSGGAIAWYGEKGNITNNCKFTSNSANENGGAIFWNDPYGSISDNCLFIYNNATEFGGAIYWSGNYAYISQNCNFTNNTAKNGGAIYMDGQYSTIEDNCYFNNNTAYENGGAIQWHEDDGTLDNCCYFINNTANQGGAIKIVGENAIIKDNCIFINNTADDQGGAIKVEGDNSNITDTCSFINNSAKKGGAIYYWLQGYNGYLSNNCIFFNNSADENGGAIGIESSTITIKDNCRFTDNSAVNGGAIKWDGDGFVSDSVFENNNATEKGGAIHFGSSGSVSDSKFISNNATDGGAIYIEYAADVSGSDFTDNTATNIGGAIVIADDRSKLTYSNFTSNSAKNGGAIFSGVDYGGTIYGNATITYANFKDNKASENGGAIYYWAEDQELNNANFTGNTAVYGGAIYGDANNINIDVAYFNNNNATNGSAIYKTSNAGNFKIANTVFERNQAHSKEITIEIEGNKTYALATVTVKISLIANDNIANAIWNDGGLNTIKLKNINCEFSIDSEGRSPKSFNTNEYAEPTNGFVDADSIWQSPYEDAQLIDILIKRNNTVIYNITDGNIKNNNKNGVLRALPDDSGLTVTKTDGSITVQFVNNLEAGTYTVDAVHQEDAYYKAVKNKNSFVIYDVNLAINKTANVTKVSNGNLVNYTITVKNIGLGNASNVIIKDVLPENMTFRQQDWGIVKSNGASINTHGVIIDNGISLKVSNITSGSYVSIWITATVKTDKLGNITNVVTTNCDENKTVVSNSTNVTVVPVVLIINKTANVTNVVNNSLVNYTITVKNIGEGNASYIFIEDKLPANLTYVDWGIVKSNGAIISVDTISIDDVVLIASNITSGNYISVWVTATVKTDKLGNITNVVTTACIENSTEVSNSTNVTVVPVVLTVNKTANVTWVANTNVVNFTIVVNNTALVNVTDVVVVDQLPANLTYVDGGVIDANGAGVTKVALNNGVQWTVSFMESNTVVRFWITAIVDTQQVGNITNSVNVTCKENDTEVKNSTNVTVVPVVLNINKTVDVSPVANNTLVNFTVTVSNVDYCK
ncbi:hypothetical protein [uncultured Methanobrevibacter sp.]|uniref:hypothetical protein n=1 Tax=uncultured Methanobrevibacter sp. TaxID=253161 RepID=UPI0025D2B4A0|nr:hypothetical protein [uncultured Methanobrevibacter sp.]